MSMVRTVIGGVDTHADFHVAAAIDGNGGMLGIESFPADAAGYEELLGPGRRGTSTRSKSSRPG